MKTESDNKSYHHYRFHHLQVSSKSPTLLSLEELIQIQPNDDNVVFSNDGENIVPIATSFHSGCLVHGPFNGLIVVGGCFGDDDDDDIEYSEEEYSNDVMFFNYIEGKWGLLFNKHFRASDDSARANVPYRIWGHSCSYSPLTRSIYTFGGIKYDDTYNEHLFSFSLETRKWKRINPQVSMEVLPCGRQGHRTIYIPSTGKIVMFGGFSSSHLDDFYEYDVESNVWSEIEEDPAFRVNRPSAREVLSMVYSQHRNSILIFGGKVDVERYSDLHEYSFTTKRWTLLHPGQSRNGANSSSVKYEPSNRSSHTAVFLEKYQKMVVLAGYNGEEWFSDCYEFDLNEMKWSPINLLTTNLSEADKEFFSNGFSSHIAEFNSVTNEILVFGGWDGLVDSNILFSIKIPTFESVEMQHKLSTNRLFSDILVNCFNNDEN